ncbi:MAG: hypothetical protein ABIE74_05550, partial [Pseudomonadota bacterium]
MAVLPSMRLSPGSSGGAPPKIFELIPSSPPQSDGSSGDDNKIAGQLKNMRQKLVGFGKELRLHGRDYLREEKRAKFLYNSSFEFMPVLRRVEQNLLASVNHYGVFIGRLFDTLPVRGEDESKIPAVVSFLLNPQLPATGEEKEKIMQLVAKGLGDVCPIPQESGRGLHSLTDSFDWKLKGVYHDVRYKLEGSFYISVELRRYIRTTTFAPLGILCVHPSARKSFYRREVEGDLDQLLHGAAMTYTIGLQREFVAQIKAVEWLLTQYPNELSSMASEGVVDYKSLRAVLTQGQRRELSIKVKGEFKALDPVWVDEQFFHNGVQLRNVTPLYFGRRIFGPHIETHPFDIYYDLSQLVVENPTNYQLDIYMRQLLLLLSDEALNESERAELQSNITFIQGIDILIG